MVVSNDIGARMAQLIEFLGENKSGFSKKIGLTNNVTIGRIINENRKPSFDVLEKIARTFGQINSEWLLTGEGQMVKDGPHKDGGPDVLAKGQGGSRFKPELKKVETSYMKVPYVPVKAQAGFPLGFGDNLYMDDLDTVLWEIDDREYKGHYVVFEVAGDSMNDGTIDSLLEGDKILCREIGRHLWRYKLHYKQWNFVLSHPQDGLVVKRITDHNVETGTIKCHSLNPYYEDFEVNIGELSALFNVVDVKRSMRL